MLELTRACRWPVIASIAFIGVLLFSEVAVACPNCKDTLAEHGSLQYGYALSIVLMIGAPFGILGGWALAIYRMLQPKAGRSPLG